MKKRWGLNELILTCEKAYSYVLSVEFSKVQQITRKNEVLNVLRRIFSFSYPRLRFFPHSQPKTIRRLTRYIPSYIWQLSSVRKVLFEFWQAIQTHKVQVVFEKALITYISVHYTTKESILDYPLHRAVFSRDLKALREYCSGENSNWIFKDIHEPDMHGNTPLMIAVKLQRYEEATVLVDYGAQPKFRLSRHHYTPLEQALGLRDKTLLHLLVSAQKKHFIDMIESSHYKFVDQLKELPDFSLVMKWECDSAFIPFLKKMTPSDNYRVYKRGADVRIDLSLVGWENLKSKRGDYSIIFKGEDKRIHFLDHENKLAKDIIAEPSVLEIEKEVNKLLKKQLCKGDFEILNTELKPCKTWRGAHKTKVVGNFDSLKYKMSCSILYHTFKPPEANCMPLNFSDYFYSGLNSEKPKLNSHSKSITSSLYTTNVFPFRVNDFLPFLDLISTVSEKAQKIKSFFSETLSDFPGFPVKVAVPILSGVKLVVSFQDLELKSPNKRLFEVYQNPYFDYPESDASTLKRGDLSSCFYYCEVSQSEDETTLKKAQEVFLSLESCKNSLLESEEDIPEELSTGNSFMIANPLPYMPPLEVTKPKFRTSL